MTEKEELVYQKLKDILKKLSKKEGVKVIDESTNKPKQYTR